MQITIADLFALLDVYEESPRWLPKPDQPAPMNTTHQVYQEAYSKGIQVAISKAQIRKALGCAQRGLELDRLKEYSKWEGRVLDIIPETIPPDSLDQYSLKVLALLRSGPC